jgi:thiamine kinase-like enzyme
MRFNELAASRAAFAAGISPEVIYAEPGALVLRYIEGRALSPELVRDAGRLPLVVDLVKRCHEQVPRYLRGPALMFWVFQVIRGYATELQACASPHAGLLSQLIERAERLEREVVPVSIVFGHNDLLAANFIDDGKRLWLIDWDYAGFNSPLFDLGGLVSNSEIDADRATFVLERYFGKVDPGLERRFAAMKCASLLREAMWSMVSEAYSTIHFDYKAYTRDYLARFGRAYDEFTRGAQ